MFKDTRTIRRKIFFGKIHMSMDINKGQGCRNYVDAPKAKVARYT